MGTHYGGKRSIYLNAVLDAQNTNGGEISGDETDVFIGSYLGGGGFFDGIIDDIRIYNRALSESEIKQLYNPNCGDACENETAGCKHATYSVKGKTLTIPFIELPVIDGLDNQPTARG